MAANIEKALFHKVTSDAAVAALIGDRLVPVNLPQTVEEFPYVVYQFISGTAIKHHGEGTALPKSRVQITCWSDDFDDLPAVDQAIKKAIDGKRENWGTGAYVTKVLHCLAETTPHDDRDSITGLYMRSRDYFIRWQE